MRSDTDSLISHTQWVISNEDQAKTEYEDVIFDEADWKCSANTAPTFFDFGGQEEHT